MPASPSVSHMPPLHSMAHARLRGFRPFISFELAVVWLYPSPSTLSAPLTSQYLANLAHELNSVPLPPLPESFELVRLPPPSQRLTEVTFDLVPTDAAMVLSDDGMRSDSESESDSDADGDVEDDDEAAPTQDAEGEDDEMEEVVPTAAAPVERDVDEDYDA